MGSITQTWGWYLVLLLAHRIWKRAAGTPKLGQNRPKMASFVFYLTQPGKLRHQCWLSIGHNFWSRTPISLSEVSFGIYGSARFCWWGRKPARGRQKYRNTLWKYKKYAKIQSEKSNFSAIWGPFLANKGYKWPWDNCGWYQEENKEIFFFYRFDHFLVGFWSWGPLDQIWSKFENSPISAKLAGNVGPTPKGCQMVKLGLPGSIRGSESKKEASETPIIDVRPCQPRPLWARCEGHKLPKMTSVTDTTQYPLSRALLRLA